VFAPPVITNQDGENAPLIAAAPVRRSRDFEMV
jgi:hypothetical protein